MKCIACGTEFSQDGNEVECPNCHTYQLQDGDNAMSMNAAKKQIDPGLSYMEILEKLEEAIGELDATIDEKKAYDKAKGEDIKELRMQIRDLRRLAAKKKGTKGNDERAS